MPGFRSSRYPCCHAIENYFAAECLLLQSSEVQQVQEFLQRLRAVQLVLCMAVSICTASSASMLQLIDLAR